MPPCPVPKTIQPKVTEEVKPAVDVKIEPIQPTIVQVCCLLECYVLKCY